MKTKRTLKKPNKAFVWLLVLALVVMPVFPVFASVIQPPFSDPAYYGVLLESLDDPDFVYQVSGRAGGISLWEDGYKKYFSWSLSNYDTQTVLSSSDGGQTFPYTLTLTRPNIANFRIIDGDICAAFSGYDFISVSEDNTIISELLPMNRLDIHPEYMHRVYFMAYVQETVSDDSVSLYPCVFCMIAKDRIAISQNYPTADSFNVYSSGDSVLYYYDTTEEAWEIAAQGGESGISTFTLSLHDFGLRNNMKWLGFLNVIRGDFSFRHFTYYFNGDVTDTSTGFINNGLHIHARFFANEADKLGDHVDPTPTPTPSSDTVSDDFHFIITANGSNYALLLKLSVEDYGTPVYIPNNTALSAVQTDYSTTDRTALYSAFFTGHASNYYYLYNNSSVRTSTAGFLYFSADTSIPSYQYALIPLTAIDSEWDVLDSTYLIYAASSFNSYASYALSWPSPGPGFAGWMYRGYLKSYNPNVYALAFSFTDASTDAIYSVYRTDLNSSNLHSSTDAFTDTYGPITANVDDLTRYDRYYKYLTLAMDLTPYESPAVTPTPLPTSTPTPTPTGGPGSVDNPIYVITPAPSGPSPTPINWLPDGGGSGNGQGGSGDNHGLNSGINGYIDGEGVGAVLGEGTSFFSTFATAFGIYAAAFAFIPDGVQFFLWLIVFLGLLVIIFATLLHTGGK